MFKAVRLLPYNKQKGFLLRTFTSSGGSKYTAGTAIQPSPIYKDRTNEEIAELSEIAQFEILSFDTEDDLRELIQTEMETAVSHGLPAVRARIDKTKARNAPAAKTRREQAQKIQDGALSAIGINKEQEPVTTEIQTEQEPAKTVTDADSLKVESKAEEDDTSETGEDLSRLKKDIEKAQKSLIEATAKKKSQATIKRRTTKLKKLQAELEKATK
jgi:hypothetical protein